MARTLAVGLVLAALLFAAVTVSPDGAKAQQPPECLSPICSPTPGNTIPEPVRVRLGAIFGVVLPLLPPNPCREAVQAIAPLGILLPINACGGPPR